MYCILQHSIRESRRLWALYVDYYVFTCRHANTAPTKSKCVYIYLLKVIMEKTHRVMNVFYNMATLDMRTPLHQHRNLALLPSCFPGVSYWSPNRLHRHCSQHTHEEWVSSRTRSPCVDLFVCAYLRIWAFAHPEDWYSSMAQRTNSATCKCWAQVALATTSCSSTKLRLALLLVHQELFALGAPSCPFCGSRTKLSALKSCPHTQAPHKH